MKSFLQIAVPLVLVGGVVGVIAYMTQNTTRTPKLPQIDGTGGIQPTVGELITFDEEVVDLENIRPIEVEDGSDQHKDFWCHTNQSKDVLLGLWFKSCGCASVDFGSFDISEDSWDSVLASPTPLALCRLMNAVKFEALGEVKHNTYSKVQPRPAGKPPLPYVIRLNWHVKTPQNPDSAQKIGIQLNATFEAGSPQQLTKEVGYKVVAPIGFWPYRLDLGDLSPGGQAKADCIVWSQTRDRLDFTARITAAHDSKESEPCAEISPPVRLTDKELAELPQLVAPESKDKPRPRSAYRFQVTLHERHGENQLEMGPLVRRLIIKFQRTSDGEQSLQDRRETFAAFIRGEVSVLNGDDVGRVNLGTFKFDRAQRTDVRLGSTDPKLELELESCSLEKTRVNLSEPMMVDGRREWVMRIDIQPSALLGPFEHYVVLKVKGTARKMRIPVRGNAER